MPDAESNALQVSRRTKKVGRLQFVLDDSGLEVKCARGSHRRGGAFYNPILSYPASLASKYVKMTALAAYGRQDQHLQDALGITDISGGSWSGKCICFMHGLVAGSSNDG